MTLKLTNDAEIEAANRAAESMLKHDYGGCDLLYRFGETSHHGARAFVEDEEGEIVMEVMADAVTAGALVAINHAYTMGRSEGITSGDTAARTAIWRSLAPPGVEHASKRLEELWGEFQGSKTGDLGAIERTVGKLLEETRRLAGLMGGGR